MGAVAGKDSDTKTGKLTAKQRRFVDEYLIDLNATQAAMRVGSPEASARVMGPRWLSKVAVQGAVAERLRERSRRTDITATRVLEEIAYVAFSDLGEAFERDGDTLRLRKLIDMPEGTRRAIESIREQPTDKGVMRSVKLHNKLAALKLLADHLGLEAPKRHELTGENGKPIAVKGVNSLTREQALEISSKILGVAKQLIEKKFASGSEEKLLSESNHE